MNENLKQLRKKGNIKSKDVAKMLDISKANYSKKENGIINFSLEEAKKVAAFFKVSVDSIFFS